MAGLFLAFLAPGAAMAGAWPRGDGNTFFSATQTRTVWPTLAHSGADTLSFYGEHGLRERLTVGAKYNRREDGYGAFQGFARWHLRPSNVRWQGAAEIGAGRLVAPEASSEPVISLAGLAGAGFLWRERNAWAEAELRQTWRVSDGTGWRNLDLTIGLAFTESFSGLVQARLYDGTTGGTEALIVPTLLIKGPFGLTTKMGVMAAPRRHPEKVAVEAGGWVEF